MNAAVQIYTLWLSRVVSTDPPCMNPSIRIVAYSGGGVPSQTIVIMGPDEAMVWEPTGEVRTMR